MPVALVQAPLGPILLFIAIYLLDYWLTLYGARLYESGAKDVIAFEGSYELNEFFVDDIDRRRRFSLRLLLAMALYSSILWATWSLSYQQLVPVPVYSLFAGALLLIEGPVIIRHLRNIFIFRRALAEHGISGDLKYSRNTLAAGSALEMLSFSGLYLSLALATSNCLLGGGALGCLILGMRDVDSARQAARDEKRKQRDGP